MFYGTPDTSYHTEYTSIKSKYICLRNVAWFLFTDAYFQDQKRNYWSRYILSLHISMIYIYIYIYIYIISHRFEVNLKLYCTHTYRCIVCTVPFNKSMTFVYGTRATVALKYQLLQFRFVWYMYNVNCFP